MSVGAARIDLLTHDQAVVEVLALAADHTSTSLVVTPNIDHVVRLESHPDFRSVYDRADLVLPDGWPVVLVAKMRGARRVGRVTGSDLVPAVVRGAAGAGLSVALVGGEAGSARGAADVFEATIPWIRLVAVEPAPREQLDSADGRDALREVLRQAKPDIVLLGLGAPRQELFADRELQDLGIGVVLCVGAGLDFVSGVRRRAPRAWQRLGLEWLYRLLQEPARLGPRYAQAAPRFVAVVWRSRRTRG